MLMLIQNEWMKIIRRPGTLVMVGLLLLMVILTGSVIKYQQNQTTVQKQINWKTALQQQVDQSKQQLEKASMVTVPSIKRSIALNEYRIKHDLNPNQKYSMWDFVSDGSGLIQLAGLFTIIIAAGIVAQEFNWGTVKLLLIRPISRGRLLLSKYITTILFALIMLVTLFVFSLITGYLLFGTPETVVPYLKYVNGKVAEQSMISHLVVFYGIKSITMLMLSAMAFMISAVFRNSSLAIGISIFLMFTGSELTMLLASKFHWAKYILFANTDLSQYFDGVPMVEGMTFNFSLTMLVSYFILFQVLAFAVFKKRDVAA